MNRLPVDRKDLPSEVTLNNWPGLASSQEVTFRQIPEAERGWWGLGVFLFCFLVWFGVFLVGLFFLIPLKVSFALFGSTSKWLYPKKAVFSPLPSCLRYHRNGGSAPLLNTCKICTKYLL